MKIGFVTDVHEDIVSLEYGLQLLRDENCEEIICLGDIVGFAIPFLRNIPIRDADACVKAVTANCSHAVIGNHDLYAIKKVPYNNAGFDYGKNWYLRDYESRSHLSKNKIWLYEDNEIPCRLSNESIDYLHSLSETKVVNIPGNSFFLSHFCHPDFTGSSINFPTEGFHLKNHFLYAESYNCQLSFSGHGHPEGCLMVSSEMIFNPGFGTSQIGDETMWIVAPCIAKTSRKNGVLVFDSCSRQLTTIPLDN